MFYSHLVLAKKGPLGKIWLAGHFSQHKRLSKQQIFQTNITLSVDHILNPSAPYALRMSGHLMLGVVRIYSKKVEYLVTDCQAAMYKAKAVHSTGGVDLEKDATNAAIDDKRQGDLDLDIVLDTINAFDAAPLDVRVRNLATADEWAVARTRTLASEEDITQESSPSVHSLSQRYTSPFSARRQSIRMLDIPDFEDGANAGHEESKRVSDVEAMRGDKSRDTSMSAHSLALEDELPPFQDNAFDLDMEPVIPDAMLVEAGPAPIDEPPRESPARPESPQLNMSVNTPIIEDSAVADAEPECEKMPALQFADEEDAPDSKPQKRKKATERGRKKRKIIVIDTAVELSSAQVREFVRDSSALERPRLQNRPVKSGLCWKPPLDLLMTLPAFPGYAPQCIDLFRMLCVPGPPPLSRKRQRNESEKLDEVEQARRNSKSVHSERESLLGQLEDERRHSMQGSPLPPTLDESFLVEPPVLEEVVQNDEFGLFEEPPNMFDDEVLRDETLLQQEDGVLQAEDEVPMTVSPTSHTYVQGKMHPHTKKVLKVLRRKLEDRAFVTFAEVSKKVSRRTAASSFFEILQLRTWDILHAEQSEAYGDIRISPGPRFEVSAEA